MSERCSRCREREAETYWPAGNGEQAPVCGRCDEDLADQEQSA